MQDEYQQEVLDLHRFLQAWLKGESPRGDGRPQRLVQALTDDFVVIHPNGTRATKADAVRGFASAYDTKPAGYFLEISRVETRMISDRICLATYHERHIGEPGRARIVTAVLRQQALDADIEWLFLQETPALHLDNDPSVVQKNET